MSLKPIFKRRQCWCSWNVRRQTVPWCSNDAICFTYYFVISKDFSVYVKM